MRDLSKPNFCKIKIWEKGEQIDLREEGQDILEFGLDEVHVKMDGSLEDKPSFCFVLRHPESTMTILGQISLKTLWPAINAALGEEIIH